MTSREHPNKATAAGLSDAVTDYDPGMAAESVAGVGTGRLYLVVRGPESTRVVDVLPGENVTIGRAVESRVMVDDSNASRHHAVLRWADDTLVLQDLGSRNGTRCNLELVRGEIRSVQGGDVVRIGDTEIVIAVARASSGRRTADDDLVEGVVVADPCMQAVFAQARRLAEVDTTALILGETGVGKEVVAAQIHRWSRRASAPFVRLNCSSLPSSLLESELFGFERGAFTGAVRGKAGYFETADGGTLFIDEVGEIPLEAQVKLLVVLESRVLRRLGGTDDIRVDLRVLAATHRDLAGEVQAGRFRQDLFYRLSAFDVRVPPLRERPTEIALLSEQYAREHAQNQGKGAPAIAPAAARALARHSWPGNVRELRNAIEHAVVLADDTIRAEHLPEALRGLAPDSAALSVRDRVDDFERREIEAALEAEGGNQTRAAKRLGITRRALIYRMQKHGLT